MTWSDAELTAERNRLSRHGLTLLERYRDRTRPKISGPLVSASKKVAVVLCGGVRKRVSYRDLEPI